MKPYPKYKPINIDWIGEIPEHWIPKKLKYFAKIMNGKDYQDYVLEEGGYPVFGTGGVFARCSKYLHDKPSVLLGRKGSVENPQYTEEPFWTSDTTYYTDIFDNTDPKFLFHLVKQINFGLYIYGSAIPSMTKSVYDEMVFPYPPLSEQQAIVSYLDQKTALIDELIAKKERKIELLKENRTALINHAVTKGLDPTVKYKDSGIKWIGDIPEHWSKSKVKWELTFHNNRRVPIEAEIRGNLQGEYPYYGASGIIDYVNDYIFEGEFILVGEDGANILSRSTPLAFLANGKFWVNNHAHILKANNQQDKYFAFQIELNDFTTKASGSAQPKLTKEAIGDLELIVPPTKKQQQIVEYLDTQTSLIDQNINLELQKIEKLKEYRQSLISNVVTGKICVLED